MQEYLFNLSNNSDLTFFSNAFMLTVMKSMGQKTGLVPIMMQCILAIYM